MDLAGPANCSNVSRMNVLKPLTTPEYLFRPRQILVRCKRAFQKPSGEPQAVTLPWGASLRVRPDEVIGANIWWHGIFDLEVAEAITRLLDAGETALDIGANIGQMTSLMSRVAGPAGRVIAFEPHPQIFAELSANLDPAQARRGNAPVKLCPMGLSDRRGQASLQISAHWDANRGTAKVVEHAGPGQLTISLETLDHCLGSETRVGVCKIDVEGHELQALAGAQQTLAGRRIRDIIFEENRPYPTPVHEVLQRHGFSLFSLNRRLFGPDASLISGAAGSKPDGACTNFLATLNPERLKTRMTPRGWRVLRSHWG
jgi:FkbM family methyltransferase